MTELSENIFAIKQRISRACHLCGRSEESVRLLLATKTVNDERLIQALDAGVNLFGENRVQELVPKAHSLAGHMVEWHMIGALQTNKVKAALEVVTCVQSVDRATLAAELERQCQRLHRSVEVLVEVNTSSESSKHGCSPQDAESLLECIQDLPHLRVRGFMTIGANVSDEGAVRSCFATLRTLSEHARTAGLVPADATELSMGMSTDLEWAIAEGSTMVRVGSAVFGDRRIV